MSKNSGQVLSLLANNGGISMDCVTSKVNDILAQLPTLVNSMNCVVNI